MKARERLTLGKMLIVLVIFLISQSPEMFE